MDLDDLLKTPLRLRATAAALAMVISGERPSLSRVAALAGVSRQALHKDHQPVVVFVAQLRAEWAPKTDTETATLKKDLEDARTKMLKERQKRMEAERQRDRALHHLELSDAALKAALSRENNVSFIRY